MKAFPKHEILYQTVNWNDGGEGAPLQENYLEWTLGYGRNIHGRSDIENEYTPAIKSENCLAASSEDLRWSNCCVYKAKQISNHISDNVDGFGRSEGQVTHAIVIWNILERP